jgi:Ni/Fe-hydrogenase subunit HybB-like protein
MTDNNTHTAVWKKPAMAFFIGLIIFGLVAFVYEATGKHPEKAWQVYLINFMIFSGIAQGGLLFSTIMHTTGARWSGPLANLSEAFASFFPVSFVLLLLMLLGQHHVFPWTHHDLHGKEVWLNVPFLMTRNAIGLLVLYGIGFAYIFHALWLKQSGPAPKNGFRLWLSGLWETAIRDEAQCRSRMNVLAVLYMLAFALVLSLLGFDLIMAVDPHWYSTLFGAYTFVKAMYVGLGALIILASILHLLPNTGYSLKEKQFHDIGKLYFAFCLLWADFFYCQLVVIWYGNIAEETVFVIERTMNQPWQGMAWGVFIAGFIAPFLILLNRKVKTIPGFMIVMCSVTVTALWFEHYLLTGPAFYHHADRLPLNMVDLIISLGFLGLMGAAVTGALNLFPELVRLAPPVTPDEEVA